MHTIVLMLKKWLENNSVNSLSLLYYYNIMIMLSYLPVFDHAEMKIKIRKYLSIRF